MTQTINDNVQVKLTIDGEDWLVSECEVVRSRISTPDYVDINAMVPDPVNTVPNLPNKLNQLIGAEVELFANNELISERDTDAEEDSLLFTGNLANISVIGDFRFEAIVYDPSQQGFATLGEDASQQEISEAGSVLNQEIFIPMPAWAYDTMHKFASGTEFNARVKETSELVRDIVKKLGLDPDDEDQVNIDLSDSGTEFESPTGETITAAKDVLITFDDATPTVKEALEKARKRSNSEWWFDKRGVFNFGLPDPTKHELKYITDADAGKVTPPYQSVRVIGSGSASKEGYERNSMNMEDAIVLEREIGVDENGDPIAIDPQLSEDDPQLKNPFTYRNAEISTDDQAKAVMNSIIKDLAEQQADGKITVVGFPEIVPLDGVKMPNSREQPMGGAGYGVYKVVHRLNGSDGFITIIHVSGPTGITRTEVSSETEEQQVIPWGQFNSTPQTRKENTEDDGDDETFVEAVDRQSEDII